MKPAIAYTLAGSCFAHDWEIIAITSEREGSRAMVYGRDQHGAPTHFKPRDVHGRFATVAQAETGRAAIRALRAHHAPAVQAAREAYTALENKMVSAIDDALRNITVTPAATE